MYAQATRVLVWLGEPSAHIRTAVSWATRYRRIKPLFHHIKLRFLSLLSTTAMKRYLQEMRRAAFGFVEVFANRYWSRMWTFQEYMLARAAPLLVWKCLHIPSNIFKASGSALLDKLSSRDDVYSSESMFAASNLFAGGRLDRDSTTMDYLCVMEAAWTKAVELLYDGDWSSEGVDFASVLLETSGRTCSDPRDRVYALYGSAPALAEGTPSRL